MTEESFEQLFIPYADDLFTYAYHLASNEHNAEDLVQETLIKAYKAKNSFQEGTNAKAWLFTILKHTFFNEYNKKKRQPNEVDYEDFVVYHEKDDEVVSMSSSDLRTDIFDNILGDEVTLALSNLSDEFKEVILLCDVENFTYEEIASILDIPIGTVRSRLHRARTALKDTLKTYAQNLGYKTTKV